MTKTILTGIKTTGTPHLGNLIGMYKPALELSKVPDSKTFYFLADYHALTTNKSQDDYRQSRYEVAATWMAFGLDPSKDIFYAQSDVPEIFEIAWVLSCFTAKGLMNRAHAYKAMTQENIDAGKADQDININMGVYNYPILMAADILTFDVDLVPVGKDQTQHVEIARDIALRFNSHYGVEGFKLPKAHIKDEGAILPGLDGRKMSKSYNNTIPIFEDSRKLKKLIFKIKTDSTLPEDPKDPDDSTLFQIYRNFATTGEIETMREKYQYGIGWGDVKKQLLEVVERYLEKPREIYNNLIDDRDKIDQILQEGAVKAREMAAKKLNEIRKIIGIK
jgi:tryptophanyl-tRNA synthetase